MYMSYFTETALSPSYGSLLNLPTSIFSKFAGKIISLRLLQYANVQYGILVILSDGRIIQVSELLDERKVTGDDGTITTIEGHEYVMVQTQ